MEVVYVVDFDSPCPQRPSPPPQKKVVFVAGKINGREMLDLHLIFDPTEDIMHTNT